MLSICETLLSNIKNHFKQNKKTNAELKSKLHELFEDNVADYDKFANWYGNSNFINGGAKDEFEHYVIEDFKKSVYGDSYAIKEFKPLHS